MKGESDEVSKVKKRQEAGKGGVMYVYMRMNCVLCVHLKRKKRGRDSPVPLLY